MNPRILIIALLGVLAAVLTVVRESDVRMPDAAQLGFARKEPVSPERVAAMADTTLRALGVPGKNIRPVRNRNDVRVSYPPGFDILNFISAMKDSLDDFDAELVSVDNARERSAVVQVTSAGGIVKSFIFSREQQPSVQKGASSSEQKKAPRR